MKNVAEITSQESQLTHDFNLELFKYGDIPFDTTSFVNSKLEILYHTQRMAESKDNISV
jgi:hypothetical protein